MAPEWMNPSDWHPCPQAQAAAQSTPAQPTYMGLFSIVVLLSSNWIWGKQAALCCRDENKVKTPLYAVSGLLPRSWVHLGREGEMTQQGHWLICMGVKITPGKAPLSLGLPQGYEGQCIPTYKTGRREFPLQEVKKSSRALGPTLESSGDFKTAGLSAPTGRPDWHWEFQSSIGD